MDNKKNGIPKLRFPGFTGAWEQRKLNEFLKTSKLKNENNKFTRKDVLSVSGDYGIVNQIKFKGRSFAGASVQKYRIVNTNDVVYTKSPLKNNPYGIIKANKGNPGIVSTLYAVYKINEKVNASFIEYYFENDYRLNTYLKPLVNKGAKNDMKVSDDNALIGNVIFPLEYSEQIKIVKFLNRFDTLIALHQRKLEHLQEQKKGLLQKMFPKNGETVPEVRFPGFTDAWEQRKLGEIVEWSKGSGLSKDALNIQRIGVPVIHYADLYKFNSVQKEVIHWTMNNIGTKIPENNLLFPMSDVTPDGLARTSTVLQSNVKAGGDVLIAKLNKDILSTFMSYQINRNKNQILPLVTGTTVRHINSKSLSTLKVTVPGKNEQKYVGSILMRFDSLIALHQRKLDHLELMKKGLLQQMFV